MTATAATAEKSVLDQIDELTAQVRKADEEHHRRREELMGKIRDLVGGAPAPRPAPVAAPPEASQTKPETAPPRRKAARKGTAPVARRKKGTAPQPSGDKGEGMTMDQAVFDVLDRHPSEWHKVLKDLPEGAEGLRAPEIQEIILAEKKWQSRSGVSDISPQITQAISRLKHNYPLKPGSKDMGKIARGDERRYYVIEGATAPVKGEAVKE